MSSLAWQRLDPLQCLDVLRGTHVTRAAFCAKDRPYVVPMGFAFTCEGEQPVIHLAFPAEGRKEQMLKENARVCLEFELPGCASVDVVLVEGRATLGLTPAKHGLLVRVAAEEMSGRRFFMAKGE